jgi:hypothetical protein
MSSQQGRTPPNCTIRFDDLSGCGVNVAHRENDPFKRLDLTFVSEGHQETTFTLTQVQADQLRAALDALTRTMTPPPDLKLLMTFATAQQNDGENGRNAGTIGTREC